MSDTSYTIWLPFPPSVNNLFSQGIVRGKVRRFPSKKYKAWRHEALVRIKAARLPSMAGHVAIRIGLTPPSSARRDVDNYAKAILDALVEARVIADDSQVQKLLCTWVHDGDQPGAVIEFGPASSERPALSKAERGALERLKRGGNRLVGPATRVSQAMRGLVEKGYVRELPGLIDNAPQGFAVAE